MFSWLFRCEAHGFEATSRQKMIYALSVLGQHYGNEDRIREAMITMIALWPK